MSHLNHSTSLTGFASSDQEDEDSQRSKEGEMVIGGMVEEERESRRERFERMRREDEEGEAEGRIVNEEEVDGTHSGFLNRLNVSQEALPALSREVSMTPLPSS